MTRLHVITEMFKKIGNMKSMSILMWMLNKKAYLICSLVGHPSEYLKDCIYTHQSINIPLASEMRRCMCNLHANEIKTNGIIYVSRHTHARAHTQSKVLIVQLQAALQLEYGDLFITSKNTSAE
jgi:hypothetical protein